MSPLIRIIKPAVTECVPYELIIKEALSEPFCLHLKLASKVRLNCSQFLYQPLSLEVRIAGVKRQFSAVVACIRECMPMASSYYYEFTLKPPLAWLGHCGYYNIYRNKTPFDIVLSILQRHHIPYKSNGPNSSSLREYCVQYQESDLNFLQRLLAKTNQYYFFEGDYSRLRLSNRFYRADEGHCYLLSSVVQQKHPQIYAMHRNPQVGTMQYCGHGYNPALPDLTLNVSAGLGALSLLNLQREHYPEALQSIQQAEQCSRQKAQQLTAQQHYLSGSSNVFAFTPAYVFTVMGKDEPLAVIQVEHHVKDLASLPRTQRANASSYSNHFKALPVSAKSLCLNNFVRPTILGLQPAIVVSSQQAAIDASTYATVNCEFPWCAQACIPIRAMQAVAGNGLAQQFIPRVGTEVMVSFISGDSDSPVIVGQSYTLDQKTPFSSEPGVQSGWRSQSLGDAASYNELSFNDEAKRPALHLHAAKNNSVKVDKSYTSTIDGSSTLLIEKGNYTAVVKDGMYTLTAPRIRFCCGSSVIEMDQDSIRIQADTISLNVSGAAGCKAAARVGDFQQCPKYREGVFAHKGGKILKGSPNVLINGKPAARAKDYVQCQQAKAAIAAGASGVLVNGRPLARVDDPTQHGGKIKQGSANVSVGRFSGGQYTKNIAALHFWMGVDYYHMEPYAKDKASVGLVHHYVSDKAKVLTHWNVTDSDGHVLLQKNSPPETIRVQGREIIAVGDRVISYPSSTVTISPDDFIDNTQSVSNGPQVEDKLAQLRAIMPPIIVNLRNDAPSGQRVDDYKLTEMEINYFKRHGNNVMLFIHGFNVPYGHFPHQVKDVATVTEENPIDAFPIDVSQCLMSGEQRTLWRSNALLAKHFHKDFMPLAEDELNGAGMHSWCLHMEDNLNRATNRFDGTDYRKFQRLLHVAWSGDVSLLDYMQSVDNASRAGQRLAALLQQLIDAQLEVNIIAHSLGNQVLLTALESLAKQGKKSCINQVFLWEAAVPATVFCQGKMQPKFPQYRFARAPEAVNKITVLYTQNDNVLAPIPAGDQGGFDMDNKKKEAAREQESTLYWTAWVIKLLDHMPTHLQSPYNVANLLEKPMSYFLEREDHVEAYYQAWIKKHPRAIKGGRFKLSLQEQCADFKQRFSPSLWERAMDDVTFGILSLTTWAFSSECSIAYRLLADYFNDNIATVFITVILSGYEPPAALGYAGQNYLKDNRCINKLRRSNKLRYVSQDKWLFTHSGMRIPSSDLMKYVYRGVIYNEVALKQMKFSNNN